MAELRLRQIGKYQIQAELGRGGFGSVYRAYDPTVGRLVAIKVLTASEDQQLLTRFKNEAASAGNLRHKNIVTIYDFGDHEGLPYIVMEFLEGEDLQQIISEKRPLTLLQKVSIMLQVADGLHCAHRSGVVHRDVKPGNIRLLSDGTVKIMDFGIARLVAAGGGAARLTRQGHVIGTLLYMAPEQVRGGEVDFLCDIFAYGITYYELLAGKHPFQGSDPRTVFYRITTEDPEPIRNIVPDCPEALEAIVNRTLHKERELRYQSLREVQLDTEPLLIELRQERASTLLAEANRLYTAGQLESAQEVLSETFDLDPGNRAARQLREAIQNQLLRRVIEPKVEALIKKGERSMAERQFLEAMETFDAALRLDRENAEIKAHLERARQLLNVSRETARLLAEARREFARDNLERALQALPETIELDPGNLEARQLLEEVRHELARREKERERDNKLRQARELLAADRFDAALGVIEELDADDKQRAEVRGLVAEIDEKRQAYERQQKFREDLARAQELMESRRYESAIRGLERLMNKYPEETEATKLFIVAHKELAAQRKREALETLRAELARLMEERQFERAVELVNERLREYPGEQLLLESIRDIETERQNRLRDEAIKALCGNANSQSDRLEFDAAIAAIDQGIETYGRDSRLTRAREDVVQAKARWEQAETIRNSLRESEQLVAAADPEQAVEQLEVALRRYPGDEQLTTGLSRARQAVEAKQRDAAISEICRQGRLQFENHDFQRALAAVDEGIAAFGEDNRLTVLRENILEARRAWERSEAIQAALEQSDQALTTDHPELAVAILESALRRYADEWQLSNALAGAREAVDAKRREAAIDELGVKVESRLPNREFEQAIADVEHATGVFGDDVRLTGLRDRIVAARADWTRAETVRHALEHARQHLANKDPEGALRDIEGALERYPDEPDLTQAGADARAALEAKRAEESISAALGEATSLLDDQQFERALAVIDDVLQSRGQDERLLGLRDRVARAKADRERSEHVRRAIQDSEEQLAGGDPERAVALLDAALDQYPEEDRLSQAAAIARQALEARRRETAIQSACSEAAAGLERLDFDQALDIVERGLRDLGADERLADLKATIVSRRTEWRRAETVRKALEQARECLARKEPEAAVQALDTALESYPGEAELEGAIAEARHALESKRVEAAVEALCREAEEQIQRREFDRAAAALERGLEAHGADARLTALQERVAAARAEWEREETIGRAIADSESRLSERNPEDAVDALEPALSRYPEDERLLSAAAAAREALTAKRRDAAIDAVCSAVSAKVEQREFETVLDEIAQAISDYGTDERLITLQQNTTAAKAEWQRSEAIRVVLQDCERRIAKAEPEHALQSLERALQKYPGDPRLVAAISSARQVLEAKHRALAIEKLTSQIRQSLKHHDFDRAHAAIRHELSLYPDDPQLAQLQQQVAVAAEQWEREQAVRRALSQSAELQGRNRFAEALQALQTALEKYPGEPRLATAHREIEGEYRRQQREQAVRELLDEANRLTGRDPEQAVTALEAASSEHPDDARVTAALDAARRARDAKRRQEAIDAVCTETQHLLDGHDFARALDIIDRGLRTFGSEKRLEQMREAALARRAEWERAEGIRRAVEDAGRSVSQERPEQAVDSLRSAIETYGPEDRLTEALAAATDAIEKKRRQEAIEQVSRETQAQLDAQKLDEATRMLDQAEEAYGAAPEFAALRERAILAKAERERAEAVRRAIDEAAARIGEGAPERAIELIDATLARYDGDPSLVEARSRAIQALDEKRKQEGIESASGEIRDLLRREEFKAAAKRIGRAEKALGANQTFEQLRSELASAKAAADERRRTAAPSPQRTRNRWMLRAAAGLAIAAAALGAALVSRFAGSARDVRLHVQTSPANATVRVENQSCASGDCRFNLKPGKYKVQVSADGYEPRTEEVMLARRGSGAPLPIALKPLSPTVQVTANFTNGQVSLDRVNRGSLQDGQFVVDSVQEGRHDLRVAGNDGAATLSFETAFAKLPALGGVSADGVEAIALGSFGSHAVVSCGGCSGRVFVDDRMAGELNGPPIVIDSLSPGSHQLRLRNESGERSIVFQAGGAPTVNMAITSNRNYGTLVVETGEDGVSVFVDGKKFPRRTLRGQLRLPVEAKEHTVRVAKEGYRAEPDQFRAVVAKGEQLQARFRLATEPARLVVSDGLPGAIVSIDGRNAGTVGADGSFSTTIAPGEHQIQFARDGYTPAGVRRNFMPGRSVQLGREEAQLTPVPVAKAPPKGAPKSPPAEAPAPDPAALELAEWQRISGNPTVAEVEEFLRKHPAGRNAQEAHRLLERLEWDATSKSSRTALQAFLKKYPNGAYASQATAELARIDNEAAAKLKTQQEADRIRSDRDEIRAVLRNYGEAYARKDVNQIVALWPSMPAKDLRDIRVSFRDFQSLKLDLQPVAEPEITGATARVQCARVTEAVDRYGSHPMRGTVTVQLERRNGRWVIDSIR